ncbi:MAG: polysaccharide deacetylase family protein [Clostridia bacterium]|nr:polysaccharide deacetylase family protein [Clostridia bacterium]
MFCGKKKAVTFSYDDGVTQDIRLIELLDKYGLKSTFNINSELLGKPNILVLRSGQGISHYKVAPEQVKRIYEHHELAVHTLTHPALIRCSDEEIIRQVEEDRKNLEALVGYEVRGMAYPCGSWAADERVEGIIREHTKIKYARGTDCSHGFDIPKNLYHFKPTVFHLDFDKMMELGQRFVEMEAEEPALFYIWGHSYEMDCDSLNWHRLEEFFKLISGREDIFYGTNSEVLLDSSK